MMECDLDIDAENFILQRIEEAAGEVMEYAVSELGGKFFIAHCDSKNIGSYMKVPLMKRVENRG